MFQQKNGVKFDWSQKEQGLILSSFFVGYIVTHIPGGLLAQQFGGKYVMAIGIFVSALLTLVTPVTVQYGNVHSIGWSNSVGSGAVIYQAMVSGTIPIQLAGIHLRSCFPVFFQNI